MYMHMYTYAHVHVRMYVYMYVCMHVCLFVLFVCMNVYSVCNVCNVCNVCMFSKHACKACMYACMCVYVCMYVRMYVCMYVCMYDVCRCKTTPPTTPEELESPLLPKSLNPLCCPSAARLDKPRRSWKPLLPLGAIIQNEGFSLSCPRHLPISVLARLAAEPLACSIRFRDSIDAKRALFFNMSDCSILSGLELRARPLSHLMASSSIKQWWWRVF